MKRTLYYTDYVRHCLRFYVAHDHLTQFRNDIDKQDWTACRDVFRRLPQDDQITLKRIYQSRGTFEDTIYEEAKRLRVPQGEIWDFTKRIEYAVAKQRGLK